MANKMRWNPEARASDFYRMYCTRMSYGGGVASGISALKTGNTL